MGDIRFYKKINNEKVKIVLILAKYDGKWIFCKHKKRDTFEICGGHVEYKEEILEAAKRELYEESGAISNSLKLLGYVANYKMNPTQYSALYYAEVCKIDKLPNFEMKEVCLFDTFPENTTYPDVYSKIIKILKSQKIW